MCDDNSRSKKMENQLIDIFKNNLLCEIVQLKIIKY